MQRGEPHRSHEWRRYFFLAAAVLAVCGVATLLTSKQQEADCGGLGLRAQQRNFETAAAAQAPQEKQGNTGEGGAAGRSAPPDSQVKALAGRRVVVSLSTFPGRVEYVAPTIYSLTSQRYQPAAIYLWVALNVSGRAHVDGGPSSGGDAAAELPESAKQVQDQFPGLVKAQVTDDVGPATKLLPTLKVRRSPNDATLLHSGVLSRQPCRVLAAQHTMPSLLLPAGGNRPRHHHHHGWGGKQGLGELPAPAHFTCMVQPRPLPPHTISLSPAPHSVAPVDDDVFYHPHTIGDLAEELVADPTHPAVSACRWATVVAGAHAA